MTAAAQLAGAVKKFTDKKTACLEAIRHIELSLGLVQAIIALCDDGPRREALLKQKSSLENALRDATSLVLGIDGLTSPRAPRRSRNFTLIQGGGVCDGSSRVLR